MNITIKEAVYLIKSTIKTAESLEQQINLDDVTEESVKADIKAFRTINEKYSLMVENVKDGKHPMDEVLTKAQIAKLSENI